MIALHHVQVSCPRSGEADVRRFYGDTLGLDEVPKPAELAKRGGVWFRGAGYELHVGVEEPFVPARKAHPALVVADIDALAARLDTAGYDITWDTTFLGTAVSIPTTGTATASSSSADTSVRHLTSSAWRWAEGSGAVTAGLAGVAFVSNSSPGAVARSQTVDVGGKPCH